MRVIDDTGEQLGIMPPQQALTIARQKGLDLVEIAATANPPVCRIMDFGRYQYQEQKRARQAKKHQKIIEVKEIKFRPKVDEHDYQFKKKHIERFLADGDKVKATIFFRGREMAHPEIGRRILERLIEDLTEVAIAETSPRQEGNQMHTILSARAGAKRTAPKPPRESAAPAPAPAPRGPGNDQGTVNTASERSETSRRSGAGQGPPRATAQGSGGAKPPGRRSNNAETKDTSRRREALQEDRDGEVRARQRVQAAHPHEQDALAQTQAARHGGRGRRRSGEAAQDDAELKLSAISCPVASSKKFGTLADS